MIFLLARWMRKCMFVMTKYIFIAKFIIWFLTVEHLSSFLHLNPSCLIPRSNEYLPDEHYDRRNNTNGHHDNVYFNSFTGPWAIAEGSGDVMSPIIVWH